MGQSTMEWFTKWLDGNVANRPPSTRPRIITAEVNPQDHGVWVVPGHEATILLRGERFVPGMVCIWADPRSILGVGQPQGGAIPVKVVSPTEAVITFTPPADSTAAGYQMLLDDPNDATPAPTNVGEFFGLATGHAALVPTGPAPGDRPVWSVSPTSGPSGTAFTLKTNGGWWGGLIMVTRLDDGLRVGIAPQLDGETRRVTLGGWLTDVQEGSRIQITPGAYRLSCASFRGGAWSISAAKWENWDVTIT